MPVFKVEFRNSWLIRSDDEQSAKQRAAVLMAEANYDSDAFTAREITEDSEDYDELMIVEG